MEPNTICDYCKKDIYKQEWHLQKYKKHFCKKSCHIKYLKQNTQYFIAKCAFCQNEVRKRNFTRKHSKTGLLFCNNLCKNRFLATHRRWLKDDVFSYSQRREILLEIGDNKCQVCDYDEDIRMLDIHHYDENRNNNKIENLRLVCVWCHLLHHRTENKLSLPPIATEKEIVDQVKKRNQERINKFIQSITKVKNPIICNCCKKEFIPEKQKQKYCSPECAKQDRRKIKWPAKEKLIELIKIKPLTLIGKQFGVSDNSIRKWAKYYKINIQEVKRK